MIHKSSDILSTHIGAGTNIWQFCVILEGAKIGDNCNINCSVFIENDVVLGNNVTVKSGVQLWDGMRIEDDVFIGPNATFTNDLIPRSKKYPETFKSILIEKGASIGANCTILGGNTIGRYSMLGAGSVITRNIPPFTLWYGNPASQKGYVTKDGIILDKTLTDIKTKNKYTIKSGEPQLL